MVEMFVFILFGFVCQYSFTNDHPMVLGTGLLGVMVFLGGVLCCFGPLFSFSIFMVVIGGVLVVFSYAIALIPFKGAEFVNLKSGNKGGAGGVGSKKLNDSGLASKKFSSVLISLLGGFWVILISIITMWKSVFSEEVSKDFLGYSDIGYFSSDYSLGMVWLGVVLFLVMVFSVGVASRYEGALLI